MTRFLLIVLMSIAVGCTTTKKPVTAITKVVSASKPPIKPNIKSLLANRTKIVQRPFLVSIDNKLTLSWINGAPPFQVYRTSNINGPWNTLGNPTMATTKDLSPHNMVLTGAHVNGLVHLAFSPPASTTFFFKVRQAVSLLTIMPTNSIIQLTWTVPDLI